MSDPTLCEHANENPARCPCPADCYCKTRTCRKTDALDSLFGAGAAAAKNSANWGSMPGERNQTIETPDCVLLPLREFFPTGHYDPCPVNGQDGFTEVRQAYRGGIPQFWGDA